MDTEDVSDRFAAIDLWRTPSVVEALLDDQLAAAAVCRAAAARIAGAADAAVARLGRGAGRILYSGAGASGRLAVQDGVELYPTFGWPAERLVYLMAGGETALVRSVEGAEDARVEAAEAVAALTPSPDDVLIAVAASGRTPWAIGTAEAARDGGALVIAIANNSGSPLLDLADCPIPLPTGPEVLSGSTRMAAGTAQKIALNALSTAMMIRLGRTYGNLMSHLTSTNAKLGARRLSILRRIVEATEAEAADALDAAGQDIAVAALILSGATPQEARARLAETGGALRPALSRPTLDGNNQGRTS